jgi:hypothetical protein
MAVGGAFLEFTNGTAGGTCGETLDGSNVLIKNLTCGGLNIGGGGSLVGEGPTPDGSTSLFALSCAAGGACDGGCAGSICNIGPTSTAPPLNSTAPDCTTTGCFFGTPLPIPNPALPSLTTCALNTWASPASGTLDLSTGASSTSVPLNSDVYLTGNVAQPCPKCVAGVCDRGPRAGLTCVATSSTGYTRDCPTGGVGTIASPCPGGQTGNSDCCNPASACDCPCTAGGGGCCDGAHVGPVGVTLSPLTTGAASATSSTGRFCTGQLGGTHAGCFGSTACRTINETGSPAGQVLTNVPADATLGSVFCIPATSNGLVNGSADLPGPGAVSLPGSYEAHN